MKNFTLLAVFFLLGMTANSQSLDFTHEGNVVTGDKVYVNEGFDELGMMYAHIGVKNQGSAAVEASLTITVVNAVDGTVSYCGFNGGSCMPLSVDQPSTRSTTIASQEDLDAGVDFISMKEGTAEALFTVTSGSLTKTITVYFNMEDPHSINSAFVNNLVTISQRGNGAELNYNFDTTANRTVNVYNVTGSKILSDNLAGTNGVLSLSLERGIYIYSVVENGKVVATHKFVVR